MRKGRTKKKNKKKKIRFSLHTHTYIYIIYRWFNTLFQKWLHSTGTSKMKTFVAEKLLPYSEVCRMDQAMFCSRLWHKLKMALCQEREARKATRDRTRRTGKVQGVAVFFHPACVLRGSPPEGVHKTPLWGQCHPLINHHRGLWLLSKQTEHRGYYMQVKVKSPGK